MDSGILRLSQIISYLRKEIYTDFALPQLHILLAVCLEEGITLPDLGKKLDMPHATVSRNVRTLSFYKERSGDKWVDKGYNLVEAKPDLYERRRLAVFLTPEGKKLCAVINEMMNGKES